MNYQELVQRDPKDLRMLAAQYGIKTHHKNTAETIAKLIVEHITPSAAAKPESLKHKAETPKAPLVVHTEAEVREVIAPFLNKEGFIAEFPGDDTVIVKFKGAEESIHLSAALRVIRMKAESVSRGMRKPAMIKFDGEFIMAAG